MADGILKKIKYEFQVLYLRVSSLRKAVRLVGIVSLLSIIVIEFCLNKIEAPYRFFYDFGQIYYRLSYSLFSAFVFYFLVVHCPRERRRVKSYRIVNNKVLFIQEEVEKIISTIQLVANSSTSPDQLTEELFREICQKVNPNLQVREQFETITFDDFYAYQGDKNKKIKNMVSSLLLLGEVINENLLYGLTNIDDKVSHHFNWVRIETGWATLESVSNLFLDLKFEADLMVSSFRKEYGKYNFEYDTNERKLNQKRKKAA